MENKSEPNPGCSRSSTEEEEFGKFLEKLANLVPDINCACESLHADDHDEDTQQSVELTDKKHDNHPQPKITNLISNQKNFSLNFNSCPTQLYTNNANHLLYIDNNSLGNGGGDNSSSNMSGHKKASRAGGRSCNVIKACRSSRRRPAPYTRHHHTSVACDSQSNHHNHSRRRDSMSTSDTQSNTENRLGLLTNVIEYIHNLKSLLQSAQSRTFDIGTQLDSNSRHCPDQQDLKRLQQYSKGPDDLLADINTHPTRSTERNFSLLDQTVTTSSGGVATTYQIPDNGPVDRAMELLEYKTGAITLTA